MPLFPSTQWMEEFCTHLVAQPRAPQVAEVLDGVYRFVVEPAGPLEATQQYDIEIRPSTDGGAPTARLLPDGAEPRLTLSARYDRWKQLLTGKLDVAMAVMMRRVRVQGDLQRLIRDMDSTKPLMDALKAVDSEWMD
jgi:hypothetical protein